MGVGAIDSTYSLSNLHFYSFTDGIDSTDNVPKEEGASDTERLTDPSLFGRSTPSRGGQRMGGLK